MLRKRKLHTTHRQNSALQRWIAFALCLALAACLSYAPASLASAESAPAPTSSSASNPSGNAVLFGRDPQDPGDVPYINSMAAVGDTLYIQTDRSVLHAFRPGDAEPLPQTDMEQAFRDLMPIGGDALMGLDTTSGQLRVWDSEKKAFAKDWQLDWDDMQMPLAEGTTTRELRCPVVADGALWLLADSTDRYVRGVYELIRFDLQSGEATVLPLSGVTFLTAYQPGKLAVCYTTSNGALTVAALDASTGQEIAPLYTEQAYARDGALAYDSKSETLYLWINDAVYAVADGALGEPVAYLAASPYGDMNAALMLPTGHFVLKTNSGIYVRNVDPRFKPDRALRIRGGYREPIGIAFARDNPDIPLQWVEGGPLVEALLAQDDGFDIMAVSSREVLSLRNKGYLADLSGSAALMADVAAMYPWVQEALLQEGKLTAYPFRVDIRHWAVDPAIFASCGVEQPATIADWADLARRWVEQDMATTHPNVTLHDMYYDRLQMLFDVLDQYAAQYGNAGEPMVFHTPVMQDVLERIAAMPESGPLDELGNAPAGASRVFYSDETPAPLINVSDSPFHQAMNMWPGYAPRLMPFPPFEAGAKPMIAGEMTLFAINPYSPNADLALRFLEYVAAHQADETRYLLRPDLNEPVVLPFMRDYVEELRGELADWTEKLTTAEGTAKSEAQEAVDRLQASIAEQENGSFYWSISPRALDEYRHLAPHVSLGLDNPWFSMVRPQELYDWMQRLIDGQLPAKDFLAELDKRMQMMFLEGQ